MKANPLAHHVVDLTPGRRVWISTLDLTWPAHSIYGLLEVDVTVARRFIAEHKERTGETLSFTGYLASCMARAVDENREVQAHRKGRKQIVMFDDVNVGLLVERKAEGQTTLMGHVIRSANRKTYREIHEEIRAVQSAPVPKGRGMPTWYRSGMLLPWPFSRLFLALLRILNRFDPTTYVSAAGTVSLSSVGMFGGGYSGWGVAPTPQPLGLVVGGIALKPAVVEGRIEPREMLSLTATFDHDIVDGGPAARFLRRLVELIESGYGLDEEWDVTATGSPVSKAAHPGS